MSRFRSVVHRCTENDNVIKLCFEHADFQPGMKELDEIRVSDCLERNWLVIGVRDLQSALGKCGLEIVTKGSNQEVLVPSVD